jgi:hypothetical protein
VFKFINHPRSAAANSRKRKHPDSEENLVLECPFQNLVDYPEYANILEQNQLNSETQVTTTKVTVLFEDGELQKITLYKEHITRSDGSVSTKSFLRVPAGSPKIVKVVKPFGNEHAVADKLLVLKPKNILKLEEGPLANKRLKLTKKLLDKNKRNAVEQNLRKNELKSRKLEQQKDTRGSKMERPYRKCRDGVIIKFD